MCQNNDTSLIERLVRVQRRSSIAGPKIEGLSFLQIVEAVEEFLKNQKHLRVAFAFGNTVESDSECSGTSTFDPINLFHEFPDQFEQINMYVEYEMKHSEADLVEQSGSSFSAYNTLLYGVALNLANNEPISEKLREFVVNHLLNPRSPDSRKVGRPSRTWDDDLFKYFAIRFAVKHNLNPTRNDTSPKTSACDAVAQAAVHLRITGYGYDSLVRVWKKRKRFQTPL